MREKLRKNRADREKKRLILSKFREKENKSKGRSGEYEINLIERKRKKNLK